MAKSFQLKLKRSLIGCTQSQRATVAALGLRKREGVVTLKDTPATRGQIVKVQHLLEVTPVK